MDVDRQGLQVLDAAACTALLGTVDLGRVAVTHQAMPLIIPVAFACMDGNPVFNVGRGVLARAAAAGQIACFEVDGADVDFANAWSVAIIGQMSLITDPDEIVQAQRLRLRWSASPASFVRLSARISSGRRQSPRSEQSMTFDPGYGSIADRQ